MLIKKTCIMIFIARFRILCWCNPSAISISVEVLPLILSSRPQCMWVSKTSDSLWAKVSPLTSKKDLPFNLHHIEMSPFSLRQSTTAFFVIFDADFLTSIQKTENRSLDLFNQYFRQYSLVAILCFQLQSFDFFFITDVRLGKVFLWERHLSSAGT